MSCFFKAPPARRRGSSFLVSISGKSQFNSSTAHWRVLKQTRKSQFFLRTTWHAFCANTIRTSQKEDKHDKCLGKQWRCLSLFSAHAHERKNEWGGVLAFIRYCLTAKSMLNHISSDQLFFTRTGNLVLRLNIFSLQLLRKQLAAQWQLQDSM